MVQDVLFVDDDDDLREVMETMLRRLGVQHVIGAGSLHEVKERIGPALGCQLAIIDINLGHGQPTGVHVHEWLHAQGFVGDTVFLTGHATNDPRVREAATIAGSRIASKPLSVAELRELIGLRASG